MAEASIFLSCFGSNRKASSENKTNTEKKTKSPEHKFSIINLPKYRKKIFFGAHLTKNLAIIQANM